MDTPDEKSIITYVSSLYNALPHTSELSKVGGYFAYRAYKNKLFLCRFSEANGRRPENFLPSE